MPTSSAWLELGRAAEPPPEGDADPPSVSCLSSLCGATDPVRDVVPFWAPATPEPLEEPQARPAARQAGSLFWSDAPGQMSRAQWTLPESPSSVARPLPSPASAPNLASAPEQAPHGAAAMGALMLPELELTFGLATGVGAGIAALVLLRWLGWTSSAGLFSRLQGDEVLKHPKRQQIVDLLRGSPGLHFADLVRQTGLSHGVLTHHLRKLVQGKQVSEAVGRGYTCYFLTGSLDRRVMMAVPLLKSEGARRVLQAIHDEPGLSVSEVSKQVQVSMASVHHHIKRLHEGGLVRRERDGRRMCHFPEVMARDTLQHLGRWAAVAGG